jgi:hypothetical protein
MFYKTNTISLIDRQYEILMQEIFVVHSSLRKLGFVVLRGAQEVLWPLFLGWTLRAGIGLRRWVTEDGGRLLLELGF